MSASSAFLPFSKPNTDNFKCLKYGGIYRTVRKKEYYSNADALVVEYYNLDGSNIPLVDPNLDVFTEKDGPCNINKKAFVLRIGGIGVGANSKPDGASIDTSVGIFAGQILLAISITALAGSDDAANANKVTYSFYNNPNPARTVARGETVSWSSEDGSISQNAIVVTATGTGAAIITALVM